MAHVTGDVQFPSTKNGRVAMGWAAAQAATTADFSHGSWFWTHFSGGLNYQVHPSGTSGRSAIRSDQPADHPCGRDMHNATCCPLVICLAWLPAVQN